MASKYDNVIIFGPTGGVGSSVAVEAGKRGAKVWLAMRDPEKKISALTPEVEANGNFARIKADLSDPTSVKEAVLQSQAKAAFIYRVQAEDGLKGSLKAMKEAGIEYVVFLSSFSIFPGQDIRKVEAQEFIPYLHAQIEIALEDLDIAHTSLRPAQFAVNIFNMGLDKTKQPWEASVLYGEYRGDGIAPLDIGRVGGAVLLDRPTTSSKEIIYLCGPKLLTLDEQWDIVKRISGKDIKIVRPTKEEYAAFLSQRIPLPIVNYLIAGQEHMLTHNVYTEPFYSDAVANIKKYSGYEPTSFEDFVANHDI